MNEEQKKKWIEDTALFYFRIFSVNYEENFRQTLLRGGGGNSSLCASWYQLSPVFVPTRVSGEALRLLREEGFSIHQSGNTISLLKREVYTERRIRFFSNRKGAQNRREVGKFFHFDHNPSNKKILSLLDYMIRYYTDQNDSQDEAIIKLSDYLKSIQTVDLVTVEQDDIRTAADRNGELLTREERDNLIQDVWYSLEIVNDF